MIYGGMVKARESHQTFSDTKFVESPSKEKLKGIFRRVFCLPVVFGGFGVP